MEKEKETQNFFNPYYKRREDNNQHKPPPHSPASMNLTEVGIDNFCTFHQQPHSEKNCPQWINSMTLVMNQLLDSKLTESNDEEEKNSKPTEKQEDDALVLCDCVSIFDTKEEETTETNVTTRIQGWLSKDRSVIPKIKRLQENVKKI